MMQILDKQGLIYLWSKITQKINDHASSSVTTATLSASGWVQNSATGVYEQTVALSGLTSDSKVDFETDLVTLSGLKSPIQPVNNNGTLIASTLEAPTTNITVQITISKTKSMS